MHNIHQLRKEGQLDLAYALALAQWQQDATSIWNKRNLGWVYFDLYKKALLEADFNEKKRIWERILQLDIPTNESIFYESLSWQVIRWSYQCFKLKMPSNFYWEVFQQVHSWSIVQPSPLFSALFKTFHTAFKGTDFYIDFMSQWTWKGLSVQDFQPEVNAQGTTLLSLVEQSAIAYAKQLLMNPIAHQSKILEFIPIISQLAKEYPKMQYPVYYQIKLQLSVHDYDAVQLKTSFLPFVLQKPNEFWVWEILSSIMQADKELSLSFLFKAWLCPSKDSFKVGVLQKMIVLLIEGDYYSEAKWFLDQLLTIRTKENWPIPAVVATWKTSNWYEQTTAKNPKAYLQERAFEAELALYTSPITMTITLTDWNTKSKKIQYSTDEGKKYWAKCTQPKWSWEKGKCYEVLLAKIENQPGWYCLQQKKIGIANVKTIVPIQGVFKKHSDQSFGFIQNVFVPAEFIKKHQLTVGSHYAILAIPSFDVKKQKEGLVFHSMQSL